MRRQCVLINWEPVLVIAIHDPDHQCAVVKYIMHCMHIFQEKNNECLVLNCDEDDQSLETLIHI